MCGTCLLNTRQVRMFNLFKEEGPRYILKLPLFEFRSKERNEYGGLMTVILAFNRPHVEPTWKKDS